jgi:hypothetical protein
MRAEKNLQFDKLALDGHYDLVFAFKRSLLYE